MDPTPTSTNHTYYHPKKNWASIAWTPNAFQMSDISFFPKVHSSCILYQYVCPQGILCATCFTSWATRIIMLINYKTELILYALKCRCDYSNTKIHLLFVINLYSDRGIPETFPWWHQVSIRTEKTCTLS